MEGLENNKLHIIFYTNHKINIPEKKNGKQNHSVKKKKQKKQGITLRNYPIYFSKS